MPQINMSYSGRMTDAPGLRAAAGPSGLRGAPGPRGGIRGRERRDPEGGDYLNAWRMPLLNGQANHSTISAFVAQKYVQTHADILIISLFSVHFIKYRID